MIDSADYYFFVIGAGEGVSGQYVLFYIKSLDLWMNSMGVALGVSINVLGLVNGALGLVVLAAGVGQLMTKGTPTGEQVYEFLSGLSYSISLGAVFVTAGSVTSVSSGLEALQAEASTSALTIAISASYGTDTPTEFCPPAYLGPLVFPTCVMG